MRTPPHSIEDQAEGLAQYLPTGKVWTAKGISGTNLRGILRGLAKELWRTESVIETFVQEIIPDETTMYIDEWERALGIPCECFRGTGTVDERRADVLVKLAALGVQTADDFVELASRFGLDVTVEPGARYGVFPMTFPILFFPNDRVARHTIVVQYTVQDSDRFPLAFPLSSSARGLGVLKCIFEKIAPANCNVIFRSKA